MSIRVRVDEITQKCAEMAPATEPPAHDGSPTRIAHQSGDPQVHFSAGSHCIGVIANMHGDNDLPQRPGVTQQSKF